VVTHRYGRRRLVAVIVADNFSLPTSAGVLDDTICVVDVVYSLNKIWKTKGEEEPKFGGQGIIAHGVKTRMFKLCKRTECVETLPEVIAKYLLTKSLL
jgi:hypothetical protein